MAGEMYRVRAATSGWSGGPGLNTFYFGPAGFLEITSAEDAQLCVDRVRDAFLAANLLYPPQTTCVVSGQVDILESSTGELITTYAVANAAPGPFTGQIGYNPIVTMLLLKLSTNDIMHGHRVKGRSFLGPTATGLNADGTPDAGLIAEANAFGTSLLDVGIGNGPPLVVWHRPKFAPVTHERVRDGDRAKVISTSVPDKFAVLTSRRD